jgi:hypothetical protein
MGSSERRHQPAVRTLLQKVSGALRYLPTIVLPLTLLLAVYISGPNARALVNPMEVDVSLTVHWTVAGGHGSITKERDTVSIPGGRYTASAPAPTRRVKVRKPSPNRR